MIAYFSCYEKAQIETFDTQNVLQLIRFWTHYQPCWSKRLDSPFLLALALL